MVQLMDVNTNDADIIKYLIKSLRGNIMVVNKEFLKSRNVPDIVSIPIYSEDYITPENNRNMITSFHTSQEVPGGPVSEGASVSELI